MNFGSFLLSFLIHALALLAIVFWPASPPPEIVRPPSYMISLVEGAPGGEDQPSPILGPRPTTPAVAADPGSALPLPEAPTAADPAIPAIPSAPAAPSPDTPPPAPAMEALPQPASQPASLPTPPAAPTEAPQPPQAAAIPTRPEVRDPQADEPPPAPPVESPPEPQAPPAQPAPEPAPQPAPTPPPPTETPPGRPSRPAQPSRPRDPIADALRTAEREATRPSGGAAAALRELEGGRPGGMGGGGGSGMGPGGGGLDDVYAGQVILTVQPNWDTLLTTRTNLVVGVFIHIDPSGRVLDCGVAESSGDARVDASAVNAVRRTGQLPPPPTPAQREVLIYFNTNEMMGR